MSYTIRRFAVLGAGTMGAAIAAHLANAGYPVYLLDIVPKELTPEEEAKGLTLEHPEVRNRIVNAGLKRCLDAKPANFFVQDYVQRITTGNMEDNFDWVGEADWIIEAVVENLAIKQQLMARVDDVRKPDSIVSTNTSGLPIRAIAEGRSESFRAHFLGTHFFNPPRYLKLLEVIPHEDTLPEVVEFVTDFGERMLGKGVVICKDTPNFIANRLFSIAAACTLGYALDHGYTVEEVDAITGPLIGRPKTATFRLSDLVGLDVAAHVSQNLYELIPHDEYREVLRHPKAAALSAAMLERGWLGNKAGQGYYKPVTTDEGKREYWPLDLETLEYRPPTKPRFESVGEYKDVEDLGERLRGLVSADDRAGQFIWATLSFTLSYAASRVPEISDDIVSIDNAFKWGFSHEMGPFETWDTLGVKETVERMERDGTEVAPWVKEMLAAGHASFYKRENGRVFYYDPASKDYRLLEPKPNIILRDLKSQGKLIDRNMSASLIDLGDGVACVEFHAKMNALDPGMFTMMRTALERVDTDFEGLVIGNQGEHFCVGANIFNLAVAAQQGMFDQLEEAVRTMQDLMQEMRFFHKPVVVAPFNMTLGGGAEVAMAGSRICAAAETYMGLVEVGVGLIPAGGGCKELIRRILSPAMKTQNADPLPFLQRVFETIALAKVSTSAEESRQMGFMTEADRVVMNRDHLLAEAKKMVLQLADNGYHPPVRGKNCYAAGRDALAALRLAVYQMHEGGYASDHDAKIANKLAYVLCGGELSSPQWVDEQYILDLEREAFLSLCGEPKTLERIWHMLQTGKPLRN